MTNYLIKSCSFCLLRVPFVSFRRFVCLIISLFGFEGRICDLIVSIPDHCLSFYFQSTACLKITKLQQVSSGFRCKVITESLIWLK